MASMVEEFEARGLKIEALEVQLTQVTGEHVALVLERDELVEKVTLVEAEKSTIEATALEAKTNMEGIFEANKTKLDEQAAEIEVQKTRIAEVEASLALAPHSHAVNGTDPVGPGGVGGDSVDHVAAMDKLQGADQIAYYREHKKAIDKAFEQKGE